MYELVPLILCRNLALFSNWDKIKIVLATATHASRVVCLLRVVKS